MTAHALSQDAADHGYHVPRWAGAAPVEFVEWYPASFPEQRARAQEWTCEHCLRTFYLMHGGGHTWIRRRVRADVRSKRATTMDTERMSYADARRLWQRIVLGRAR
ncbi:hypothetical protein AB0B89_31975 [Sphaerisporangium sp. NPDC049002]|uniref:hypothetical protein n=1 Tax=Sphaerisporangium sp. NPDC049002 TaxID=3155392 RepID=UPI00340F090F